mmetsp:Transcript_9036/g.19981  ORF Transcript_9036/g.19981 Transcript_9036/m.19981 type:complete len:252 (+) Transcript_9036:1055-1810(+)
MADLAGFAFAMAGNVGADRLDVFSIGVVYAPTSVGPLQLRMHRGIGERHGLHSQERQRGCRRGRRRRFDRGRRFLPGRPGLLRLLRQRRQTRVRLLLLLPRFVFRHRELPEMGHSDKGPHGGVGEAGEGIPGSGAGGLDHVAHPAAAEGAAPRRLGAGVLGFRPFRFFFLKEEVSPGRSSAGAAEDHVAETAQRFHEGIGLEPGERGARTFLAFGGGSLAVVRGETGEVRAGHEQAAGLVVARLPALIAAE